MSSTNLRFRWNCLESPTQGALSEEAGEVKRFHELRDAIHVFVRMDSPERRVVDSPAVQRLRHIQQLALTSLIYPGATHRRFEHSLGVMELAGRIYDVVASRDLRSEVKEALK